MLPSSIRIYFDPVLWAECPDERVSETRAQKELRKRHKRPRLATEFEKKAMRWCEANGVDYSECRREGIRPWRWNLYGEDPVVAVRHFLEYIRGL